MHMMTVEKSYKKRGPRGGRRQPWTVKRDILIPAPRGTSKRDLLKIARKTLPKSEQYALKLKTKTRVAEGPKTRAKKAKLR